MTDFTGKKINRLIIIGNGFDLAHGLKTSFYDFINYCAYEICSSIISLSQDKLFECKVLTVNNNFFKNLKNNNDIRIFRKFDVYRLSNDRINDIYKKNVLFKEGKKFDKYDSGRNYIYLYLNHYKNKFDEIIEMKTYNLAENTIFNNVFFIYIMNRAKNRNLTWGGIESDFYDVLLHISNIKPNTALGISSEYKNSDLNEDFNMIITCFEIYLSNLSAPNISDSIRSHINDHINSDLDKLTKKICVLNFNYTKTLNLYKDYIKNVVTKIIHIHGELNNKKNPIIFGYGDETDDSYQKLQDMNNNEYLKFAKSLHYQLTDNYRKLLDFLDSDYYQVYIWGHSCSISDRVLLNTIFEHNNCISIKPFYYDNGTQDNYFDLITNISRNFKDKKRFREIVLNKNNCTTL